MTGRLTPTEYEELVKFVNDSVRADLDAARTAAPAQFRLDFSRSPTDLKAGDEFVTAWRKMVKNLEIDHIVCPACGTFYHRDHPDLHAKTCRGTR